VFGSFLSWMQEKVAPVFVVATANDVSQLPPEMLRKGRFDELFAVDLPNDIEREAIWKIVVERRKRDSADFDLQQLSRVSAGLTGAEIEAVFVESLFSAFERSKEPTDLDVASALNGFVPLSRLMAEQIEGLRKWSSGRARPATSQPTASEPTLRKLGV
jgi:SpoVK/Ycf46/Vps4 family AAA+-type ATPase